MRRWWGDSHTSASTDPEPDSYADGSAHSHAGARGTHGDCAPARHGNGRSDTHQHTGADAIL